MVRRSCERPEDPLVLLMGGRPRAVDAGVRGGTITAREDLTPSLAFFRVRFDDAPRAFVPGQYLTLGITAGTGVVERAYSIASSTRRIEDGYELYVRLVPGGALTPRLFASGPGQRVSLRGPKGRFVLRADDARLHLFVATGCGIAPFMSMLRTLRDDDSPRRVMLLHGVSYVSELAYRGVLEELARDPRWQLTYVPTISRPRDPANAGWPGRTGRVELAVTEICGDPRLAVSNTVAYLCGNPEMIAAVEAILRDWGSASDQIHRERYWPPAAAANG